MDLKATEGVWITPSKLPATLNASHLETSFALIPPQRSDSLRNKALLRNLLEFILYKWNPAASKCPNAVNLAISYNLRLKQHGKLDLILLSRGNEQEPANKQKFEMKHLCTKQQSVSSRKSYHTQTIMQKHN